MSDTKFSVGDTVTILDVQKQGEVVSVSEDGSTYEVKAINDDGTVQMLSVAAGNLGAADEDEAEIEEEEAPEGTEAGDEE